MSCITKNAYQWSVKSVANYTDRVENVQSFTGMWREYIKPQSEKWREKKKTTTVCGHGMRLKFEKVEHLVKAVILISRHISVNILSWHEALLGKSVNLKLKTPPLQAQGHRMQTALSYMAYFTSRGFSLLWKRLYFWQRRSWRAGEIDLVRLSYTGCFCVWSCNLDLEDRGAAIRKGW